jgi:hypothetical protein
MLEEAPSCHCLLTRSARERIPVPDTRLLSETELETLAALLDEAERESRGERVRKALDEEVRKLLER